MAGERILLRTQKGDAVGVESAAQAFEPLLEQRQARDPFVASGAAVVGFGLGPAGPELQAERHVADAGASQRRLQRIAVELRIELAERTRAHIRDRGDGVAAQDLEESVQRMIRVADRQQASVGKCLGHESPSKTVATTL